MRFFVFACTMGVGTLAGAAQSQAAQRPPHQYTIEALMASDSLGGLAFSPDGGKLLFTSNRSGIANLYELPLAGGKPRQLTRSTLETLNSIGYFPKDERILYSSDQGGNELNHVFVRERDGSIRDLTPGEKLKAQFAGWASDGRSFFLTTNERNPRFFDLYEYSAADYQRRLLFQNDQAYHIEAISPDRSQIALSVIRDNATTDAYLYDTATKQLQPLQPQGQGIVNKPQAYSRDGHTLFCLTNEGKEFQYLIRIDLRSGARRTVLQPNWDVVSAGESRDGRYLIVGINEDARTRLRVLDLATLQPVAVPEVGAGTLLGFSIADHSPQAAALLANGDVPGDVYLLNLKTGAKKRLLRSLSTAVAQRDLVAGEVARFESYDGLTVPGILYVPKDHPSAKRPGVISVHGGPGSESQIGYKPLIQFLVNQGYAVYEVNNRGSSGSGKTFYHLDDHKHGEADLDDVVAAKRLLIEKAQVDPERIAILGGSYGGYMTLAALSFRPEAFAAGVDMYGVSNWPRLLSNTPSWWEDLRRLLKSEMGDWEHETEYLQRISPVFHADEIQRPLLVLQGANDPRVLPVESEDIVAQLRAHGVPVEYRVFPDEGHGFRKRANQIEAYKAIVAFLDKYVKERT